MTGAQPLDAALVSIAVRCAWSEGVVGRRKGSEHWGQLSHSNIAAGEMLVAVGIAPDFACGSIQATA
jgi:hypothetical protein